MLRFLKWIDKIELNDIESIKRIPVIKKKYWVLNNNGQL